MIPFLNNIFHLHFWNIQILGNSILDLTEALGIFLGTLAILKVIQIAILGKLNSWSKNTENNFDDVFIKIIESFHAPFVIFFAFYLSLEVINITPWLKSVLNIILIVWLIYKSGKVVEIFINYGQKKFIKKTSEESRGSTEVAAQILGKTLKAILWVVAGLLVLSNLGVKIGPLLAGLGVGGVAVALAAQNILGDLFNSFVIYFDKPFVVGDFIKVKDKMGTVEKIGLKTTRIRSLQGEELVFSNTQLTSQEIQNFGQMKKRRGELKFGVEYDTLQEKLEKIPEMVRTIVEGIEKVEIDRIFFEEFGDSAIGFELIYYVQEPDYNLYAKKNQQIAFAINESFQKKGISMAFPTRTVHLKKDE
ncbi:MAG: mechanosensitive ion channel family protein [Candidatus Magasanikbacteria bacterium]